MVKKKKWIVGLSIASMMALLGGAFVLNPGSVVAQSVGKPLGLALRVATTPNQGTVTDGSSTPNVRYAVTRQPVNTTSSSTNNNSNGVTTPEYNGYNGGYGMMGGGLGEDGYSGGYGMMGGLGENGYSGGYGMMGGLGGNSYNGGYGMMGGSGTNGYGGGYNGMMGGGYNAQSLGVSLTNGQVATSDQAIAITKAYTQKLNPDVVVAELHEFSNGYEVELKEAKTGAEAYEVIVYKNGGQVIPEMGPNIMWNTKYGAMNWSNTGDVTVTEEQATKNAQEAVTKMGQGYSIGKAELAPGYYEFMIQKDGKDYSELDVNGYTGQVWFENWQGPILNTIDVK
ncbi:PepSY domain-containing protein [Desulfosporosinus sp. BG]|uniref:PepSY domain-containing protein n=1 Tax=Desulfosporosinus sp. BG TaxID=1633135 RepID=UPI00083A9821|nr:PepSY domain-containing protein [Desulfosporosinus sp. BG]ODA40096.1 hypothetical protein DSBG_3130 [Desulfosporosinus sp. BG]